MKDRKPASYTWLYYIPIGVFLLMALLHVVQGRWSDSIAWLAMATSFDTARYVRVTR